MSERDTIGEAPFEGNSASIAGHYERFTRYLDIERYEDADRQLSAVLAIDPHDALAHALRGRVRLLMGQPDEAQRAAGEALSLDPRSVVALWVLADVASDRGQHSVAERHILEALAVSPNDPDLLRAYASLLHTTGHLDKSQRLLERALAIDPDNSAAHSLMGVVQVERGRRASASRHAAKALALAPEDSNSHAVRGILFEHTGNPFAARRHLREALRRDPSSDGLREAFERADRNCRVVMLPAYWFGELVARLPGGPFMLWGLFIVSIEIMRRVGVPPPVVGAVAITYVVFCIYTWLSEPITSLWIKYFPAR